MMGKAQEAIMKLAARKNELSTEYEDVQVDTEANNVLIAKMREEFEEADCQGCFDASVAAANEEFDNKTNKVAEMRDLAEIAKADFEQKIADKIATAAANRDSKNAESDEAHTKADADKEAALADLEAAKVAFAEENAEKRAAIEEEIKGINDADQADYDAIAEEIKGIAENLLALNEQMQEKLTALTQL